VGKQHYKLQARKQMSQTIIGAVGRGGDNRKPDTRKIQRLLNAIFPATVLVVDGQCGAKTIRRIERFQRRFTKRPDGRVDPGGRTLKRLSAAAPALQQKWIGDSSKWSEKKKLASLDSRLRPKTARILQTLKSEGFKPKIFFAWRSVAVQQRLVEKGNSKVRFSFHNAQKKNGTPNAYAADIIDKRWAWGKRAERRGFWDALGQASKAEGLYWGGNWRNFKDVAHVQLFPNRRLSEIRRQSGLA
jgi:peptidoglycan L-alanyl-D-glutamate endopeptidase CwlK